METAAWRPRLGTLPAGEHDAITDVPGVLVGHTTLVHGDGALVRGEGPVRTGVTVIRPHGRSAAREPVFAGHHVLNGNGEVTGLTWLAESGLLSSPIGLTNTHSVGVVRDTLAVLEARANGSHGDEWFMPVVGETWDGVLNDINGGHVRPEHVEQAVANAAGGTVPMGSVGGGTGMICHGFKGGIGSGSRRAITDGGEFTVGVLVQANHGRRARLVIDGVPVGRLIDEAVVPLPGPAPTTAGRLTPGAGSIVAVVATDAPLLPHQCRRLAQRAGLGVARTGGTGEHSSGDVFVAFSTGSRGIPADVNEYPAPATYSLTVLHNAQLTPLFDAVIEATEQAIVNALLAAQTMVGRDGNTAYAIDAERLRAALGR